MNSVICTLFERYYHRGLVALINSLHKSGFKGDVYAGYLGPSPHWAKISEQSVFENQNIETCFVCEDIRIHFIPLKTTNHLTNYKPDFMKWVLNGPAKNAESIFYFDPDIVIAYDWRFFEEWVGYGVAVCEDTNSPMALNHPRRMAWCNYYDNFNISVKFNEAYYANGGFLGLHKKDAGFISSWIAVQEHMSPLIGGLHKAYISGKHRLAEEQLVSYFPFNKTDQDALNVAIGAWDGVVSFVGKEGMAFKPGPELMFHALGSPKPWNIKFLKKAFSGIKPRRVDKEYWQSVAYPIRLYPNWYLTWKKFTLNAASFIVRFYGK